MVSQTLFGTLPDGQLVHKITLQNTSGILVDILSYGAIVHRILTPDRNKVLNDIVLGYDSITRYLKDEFYLGAAIGRYANRIAKGRFTLNGKEYQLPLNNNGNHLHGGPRGLHKVLWEIMPIINPSLNECTLKYISSNGEGGYPGTVNLAVTFSLNDLNEFGIRFDGVSSEATILNLSHHSYFNLSGDLSSNIHEHELEINAATYTPILPDSIPTGAIDEVENTPMDFRSPKRVGKEINDNFNQLIIAGGYDHNWVLNGDNKTIKKSALLFEPASGRYMELYTNQPGIQFYSGNFLSGVKGKDGVVYNRRSGLCLETQNFPDAPNHANFPSAQIAAGEVYSKSTIYKFTVR